MENHDKLLLSPPPPIDEEVYQNLIKKRQSQAPNSADLNLESRILENEQYSNNNVSADNLITKKSENIVNQSNNEIRKRKPRNKKKINHNNEAVKKELTSTLKKTHSRTEKNVKFDVTEKEESIEENEELINEYEVKEFGFSIKNEQPVENNQLMRYLIFPVDFTHWTRFLKNVNLENKNERTFSYSILLYICVFITYIIYTCLYIVPNFGHFDILPLRAAIEIEKFNPFESRGTNISSSNLIMLEEWTTISNLTTTEAFSAWCFQSLGKLLPAVAKYNIISGGIRMTERRAAKSTDAVFKGFFKDAWVYPVISPYKRLNSFREEIPPQNSSLGYRRYGGFVYWFTATNPATFNKSLEQKFMNNPFDRHTASVVLEFFTYNVKAKTTAYIELVVMLESSGYIHHDLIITHVNIENGFTVMQIIYSILLILYSIIAIVNHLPKAYEEKLKGITFLKVWQLFSNAGFYFLIVCVVILNNVAFLHSRKLNFSSASSLAGNAVTVGKDINLIENYTMINTNEAVFIRVFDAFRTLKRLRNTLRIFHTISCFGLVFLLNKYLILSNEAEVYVVAATIPIWFRHSLSIFILQIVFTILFTVWNSALYASDDQYFAGFKNSFLTTFKQCFFTTLRNIQTQDNSILSQITIFFFILLNHILFPAMYFVEFASRYQKVYDDYLLQNPPVYEFKKIYRYGCLRIIRKTQKFFSWIKNKSENKSTNEQYIPEDYVVDDSWKENQNNYIQDIHGNVHNIGSQPSWQGFTSNDINEKSPANLKKQKLKNKQIALEKVQDIDNKFLALTQSFEHNRPNTFYMQYEEFRYHMKKTPYQLLCIIVFLILMHIPSPLFHSEVKNERKTLVNLFLKPFYKDYMMVWPIKAPNVERPRDISDIYTEEQLHKWIHLALPKMLLTDDVEQKKRVYKNEFLKHNPDPLLVYLWGVGISDSSMRISVKFYENNKEVLDALILNGFTSNPNTKSYYIFLPNDRPKAEKILEDISKNTLFKYPTKFIEFQTLVYDVSYYKLYDLALQINLHKSGLITHKIIGQNVYLFRNQFFNLWKNPIFIFFVLYVILHFAAEFHAMYTFYKEELVYCMLLKNKKNIVLPSSNWIGFVAIYIVENPLYCSICSLLLIAVIVSQITMVFLAYNVLSFPLSNSLTNQIYDDLSKFRVYYAFMENLLVILQFLSIIQLFEIIKYNKAVTMFTYIVNKKKKSLTVWSLFLLTVCFMYMTLLHGLWSLYPPYSSIELSLMSMIYIIRGLVPDVNPFSYLACIVHFLIWICLHQLMWIVYASIINYQFNLRIAEITELHKLNLYPVKSVYCRLQDLWGKFKYKKDIENKDISINVLPVADASKDDINQKEAEKKIVSVIPQKFNLNDLKDIQNLQNVTHSDLELQKKAEAIVQDLEDRFRRMAVKFQMCISGKSDPNASCKFVADLEQELYEEVKQNLIEQKNLESKLKHMLNVHNINSKSKETSLVDYVKSLESAIEETELDIISAEAKFNKMQKKAKGEHVW